MTEIKLRTRPFVLIIRDGWGHNPNPEWHKYDATKLAKTPYDEKLRAEYPNVLIATSGEDVGLPDGTMGNSEVGHQNIGAGRVVYQESVRLTKAIRDGEFQKNQIILDAIENCKKKGTKLHLTGLASDIGVHSLLGHLYAFVQMCKDNGLEEVYIHPLMDGRDSPPTSGKGYLTDIQAKLDEIGCGKIASIGGRFYGMDRDNRWERVERAFNCMRHGKGETATNAIEYLQASYDNAKTDEFIEPANIVDTSGKPIATIDDGDAVIFFNFRGDRPRELTRAFVDPDFSGFDRGSKPDVDFICMTQYDKTIPAKVAFPKPPKMKNIAGELLSIDGLKQFRCAETEKYAHVTFFFNDNKEDPFALEERILVPSPKVETYDLKPEMSAYEVCDTVLEKLDGNEYDVFIINFANPDMVGHTGVMEAAVKAAEVVDECVGKVIDKVKEMGGSALITADHGNLELMWDESTNGPYTAHTTFPVPLIIVDEEHKNSKLREDGRLADVVPTCLELMGLEKPAEMTGESLLK